MESFFSKLAERLNSENDLSDMTWALCSSNDAFQKIFLDYCFDKSIINDIDYMEREVAKNNTRPDIIIKDNKNNEYLLEVKKYDKNIHDNYKETFKGIPRAFIANYKLSENNTIYKYKKTWHGLIEYIEKQNGINNPIVKEYLDYIKAVTNYFKGESMNLSNLHSLNILLKTIKQIIESTIPETKPKYAGDDGYSGYKFKFDKANRHFNIWFGITFGDKENYLLLEFLDDCSPSVNKTLKDTSKGKYFRKPEKDKNEGSIYVEIESKYLKMLHDNEKSFEDQRDLLKSYFEEVMNLF